MEDKKKRKNLHLRQETILRIEELSKKSSLNQSCIVDKILTDFFSKGKRKIDIGMTI
jgi:hypothetical protein